MDTAAAFTAYEAARHRLPAAGRQGRAQSVHSLAEIADRFDVFLLDAFGVLNIGEQAIPGAPERIAALQAAGKRTLVLTNAASAPVPELLAKYARLGFHFAADDVVSSRMVALDALHRQPSQHWGLMAPAGMGRQDIGGLRFDILGDDPAAYESVQGFLLLGSAGWTDRQQALLEASLLQRSRPVVVANPDIVAPREIGFSLEPGHFAHHLADRTGVAPQFFGKPFAGIFDMALARLPAPVDRSRVVMVGDSLHTDVLGAQVAGVASALVTGYGFLAGHPAQAYIDRAGLVPDFLLDRP